MSSRQPEVPGTVGEETQPLPSSTSRNTNSGRPAQPQQRNQETQTQQQQRSIQVPPVVANNYFNGPSANFFIRDSVYPIIQFRTGFTDAVIFGQDGSGPNNSQAGSRPN